MSTTSVFLFNCLLYKCVKWFYYIFIICYMIWYVLFCWIFHIWYFMIQCRTKCPALIHECWTYIFYWTVSNVLRLSLPPFLKQPPFPILPTPISMGKIWTPTPFLENFKNSTPTNPTLYRREEGRVLNM